MLNRQHVGAARGYHAARPTRQVPVQPDYPDEISDSYLEGLQRRIDADKAEDFLLTPITAPGW